MTVVLILGLIWGIFYLSEKKNILSGKVYFALLAIMLLPVSITDTKGRSFNLLDTWYHDVNPYNMVVFALCLLFGFIPWLIFDKWLKNRVFRVPDYSIKPLKYIFFTTIILSFCAMGYLLPFGIATVSLDADDVRNALYQGEYSALPANIYTTLACAVAACNIYCVLFFYLASLRRELFKFRIWLVVASLSYLINCMCFAARDGFVFLPLQYLILYFVFKKSFTPVVRNAISKYLRIVLIVAAIFIGIFSISRFYKTGNIDHLYSGTLGYMTQQPYVFDSHIEEQDDFWGYEVRFRLVNRLLGIPPYKVNKADHSFEWSFGTMYAEFYSSKGWFGLIVIPLVIIGFYILSIKYLTDKRRSFAALLMFVVYMFIVISGMFYFRAGTSIGYNIFYLIMSFVPFFVRGYVHSHQVKYVRRLKVNKNPDVKDLVKKP